MQVPSVLLQFDEDWNPLLTCKELTHCCTGNNRLPASRFSEDDHAGMFEDVSQFGFAIAHHPAKVKIHVERYSAGFIHSGKPAFYITIRRDL
jgi:hypothetical protein